MHNIKSIRWCGKMQAENTVDNGNNLHSNSGVLTNNDGSHTNAGCIQNSNNDKGLKGHTNTH